MRSDTRVWMKTTLVALGLAAAACVGRTRIPARSSEPIVDLPHRAGLSTILIAMPNAEAFRAARRALVTELSRKFNLVTVVVDSSTTASSFSSSIQRVRPSCLVLMDNSTVSLLRTLQGQHGAPLPPAVIFMTAFLQDIKGELTNVEGVVYEVPGVTSFVQLRTIVAKTINRVGVVHRHAFRGFIERERALAAKEQIALIGATVPREPSARDVIGAIESLRKQQIDALWILNDSGLIRDAAFLQEAWLEPVSQLRVPTIVNVQTLIDPRLQFGTLAVLPDHDALASQVANMVFDLADNEFKLESPVIELPTSTITIVDMTQLNAKFELRKDAEKHIDKPLL